MKQKLLSDIELDVHELKYLMESFSKEPTPTLADLLQRSILQMQERLGQLSEEIDVVRAESSEKEEKESEVLELIEDGMAGVSEMEVDEDNGDDEAEAEETEADETEVEAEETEVEEAETVEAAEFEPSVITVQEETLVIEEHKPMVLGECIKLSAGLRQSISLNDSFRFARELFAGDTELMNRVIEQISVMSSYKTAVAFLSSKVDVNQESEALNDFLELLKKYFNQSA